MSTTASVIEGGLKLGLAGLNFPSLFSAKSPSTCTSVLSNLLSRGCYASVVTVFCAAEVSLFCFDRSVVTLMLLQKSISYTTLPPLLELLQYNISNIIDDLCLD